MFERAGEQGSGGVRVSDGGAFADSEDGGWVQCVRAVDEGFFELAVHADLVEGCGDALELAANPVFADRAMAMAGLVADEQVRVEGVGPTLVALAEVVRQQIRGQLVEAACVPADGDAAEQAECVDDFGGSGDVEPETVDEADLAELIRSPGA